MKVLLAGLPAMLMSTLAGAQSPEEIIVVRQLAAHVMQVRAETLGSAVALNEHLAVTNCHVLGTAQNVRLTRGGLTSSAKLTTGDTGQDLCLLEVDTSPGYAVQLGSTASLSIGEKVYAVGFGAGRLSIGIGKVEALYPHDGSFVVRTDAPFSAGASGGALFDSNQKLVGVLTFYRRGVETSSYWAMPADWIDALKHKNLTIVDRSRLPIWSQERAASIRFLEVAGHEIDGNWSKMSEAAKLWVAEEPQNKEAERALHLATAKLTRHE